MKTLAKLLYVEADEEITDLVDRLRDASLEDAVTFVVPERARSLQSAMSFRLLKRYADSYGKHVNVITSDPRLQALSMESGFSAFPSLGAYDSGTEVHRPELGEAPELEPLPSAVATLPAPRRETTVVSAPPKRTTPAAALAKERPPLRSYRPYLIAAGILAILALVGIILYLPTATATLTVSGTPIKQDVTLSGAPSAPTGSTDRFTTQALHASESQTVQGVATGQKPVPAQPSVGDVVFSYNCFFLCDNANLRIPSDTTVSTNSGKHYKTQKAVTVSSPHGSATVAVKAVQAGPDGNTDTHSITVIDGNRDFNLGVDNTQPTSGGADARTATVIQQTDIDSIVSAYTKDAIPRVTDQINGKAQGLHVVSVADGVKALPVADHKVNDEVANFNVTVTVSGDAVAFDEKAVKNMLAAALKRKVPQGSQLNGVTTSYEPASASADGTIQLNGHASGFYTPVFLDNAIRSHLKGSSPASANAFLRKLPNVVDARVVQQPFGLPWLPLFSSRITLKIQEVSGSASP